ncbi:hypothetical protein Tco_0226532 [Tanacetum coccineum]
MNQSKCLDLAWILPKIRFSTKEYSWWNEWTAVRTLIITFDLLSRSNFFIKIKRGLEKMINSSFGMFLSEKDSSLKVKSYSLSKRGLEKVKSDSLKNHHMEANHSHHRTNLETQLGLGQGFDTRTL